MTKYVTILLALFLLACNSPQELSPTRKLQLTAKVWGFLKYYHPKVNEGKVNWDQQLIDFIPKLDQAKTAQDLSNLYIQWIDSLGEVPPCNKCEPSKDQEYFDKNFNLSWLSNETFSSALIDKLIYIQHNRTQEQHYIRLEEASTYFTNEPAYTASQWQDENIRLVTLFKYWNVIEYFYPYKYVMDRNWDDQLDYFIPKFRGVKTEQEYHLLLRELTISLCDSHAFFTTDLVRQYAGNKFIAGKFIILDDKAVINGFYDDSLARLDDIRLGDVILAVNDRPVSEIYKVNEKYINGSNEAVKKLGYSFRWVFNGNSDSVRITYDRMGKVQTKTIRRYDPTAWRRQGTSVRKWEILSDNIGYVNLEEDAVVAEDLPQMMKELNGTKAILFDLRNYPEFMWHELLPYFTREKRPFAKVTKPDLSYPGRFIWTMGDSVGTANPSPYKGKVIILMNEDTQSRAESFVMALQGIQGAVTVGRQTSGADGDVADFTFFDDKTTWLTMRGIYYPDGRETQRIGIVPDVEVSLTLEDIRTGRDAILEKAMELAREIK